MASYLKRLATWYDKLAAINVENLFVRKREPGPPRSIYVNQDLPTDYYDQKGRVKKIYVYASNQVITSKYTIITFLPRNLLEQFRRIANVFFLGIAILQFFPIFSTVSDGLVILPLLIVLAITGLKDGYEDIKRHQSDRNVNHSSVHVLSGGGWANHNAMAPKSKTFVPGAALVKRLTGNRKKKQSPATATPQPTPSLPAMEVELLERGVPPEGLRPVRSMSQAYSVTTATDEEASGFETDDAIERAAGQGGLFHSRGRKRPHWRKRLWEDVKVGDFVKIVENQPIPADILICATSEDENVAFVETKNLDGETNLKSRSACPALTHLRNAFDCADKLNTFRIDCDRPDTNLYKINATVVLGDNQKTPVDLQMVLLRGTVLRNTGWIIGVVLFTGEDTKIVLNSGGTPSKRSKVERQMNPQVFINLIILAVMAVVCGIADALIEQHYFPLNAPWLYEDTQSDDNPHINGLITWAFALITFQNIVPISLYISIEFVRTAQALFIYFDKEMYYEKTDQATLARSWNLSDDLGQIEYIFSDKTGTLTQNSMVFRQCSIGGKAYMGDPEGSDDDKLIEVPLAVGSEGKLSRTTSASAAVSGSRPATGQKTPNSTDVPNPIAAQSVKLSDGVLMHFRDSSLNTDIESARASEPNSESASSGRTINAFWSTLALCHTALVSVDPASGAIEYKAQSPDESALVQAAADVGFIFRRRDREILTLQTPFEEELEKYELLNILAFNSARKRMSVIVRKLTGEDKRIFLLTKGADNVIFERLRSGFDGLKKATEEHLDAFASEGLRTLTLAYRVIPDDEFQAWAEKYHEATTVLEDREDKIDAISEEIEHDLILLGATAIEDRLQDGVPETIADLKEAGIKVWVATGDKLETAIAIGHSTNLIGRDDNIIIVRGGGDDLSTAVYLQMQNALEKFFPEVKIPDEIHSDQGLVKDEGGHDLRRINTGVSSLVGQDNGRRSGGFVFVIDGGALGYALGDDPHKQLLLRLATQCDAVICCRVSPLQKALVVKLVKDGLGCMTLAIGDGANDVSMIQAADVGIGISGEEGLQAVNSSDYAIAQFRFLKRLLLVHGHWSYNRNGNMIVNFFYKNVIGIGVLWWFQIFCGWSSQYVFEYTYILFWNSFWTIAPPIGIGVFDRVADDHVLMAMPQLYEHSRKGEYFGLRIFLVYMFEGFFQSAIIFFIILYTYFSPSSRSDGYDVYIYEFSTTMALSAVMVACLYNGLNTAMWTAWVFFAVSIGIILLWIYTAIYSIIAPGWFSTPIYGNDHYLFHSAYFWLSLPITIILPLLPRYVGKAYEFAFNPSDMDRVRWLHKIEPKRDFSKDKDTTLAQLRGPVTSKRNILSRTYQSHDFRASRTDMSTGMTSVHRGFDFSTEENGVAMQRIQSNLSERHSALPFKRKKREGSRVLHSLRLSRSIRKKPPPENDQTPLN